MPFKNSSQLEKTAVNMFFVKTQQITYMYEQKKNYLENYKLLNTEK